MLQETDLRAHKIFRYALSRFGEDRASFVRDSCAADDELRTEVDLLLEASSRAEGFLETPAIEMLSPAQVSIEPADAMIGRKIGGFTILSIIATGGMGAV